MTRSRWLFGSAVFLGAFLLFLVEPIAAKQLLPVLGGSAAVWITCLVFFQTALLCAYLYAHWMSNRPRWVLYFSLLLVGFASAVGWCWRGAGLGIGTAYPILTVFAALGSTIGLPFLVLGTTSPLMQVWWARLHQSPIPYRLFALSNLASLLALAALPDTHRAAFDAAGSARRLVRRIRTLRVNHRSAGLESAVGSRSRAGSEFRRT